MTRLLVSHATRYRYRQPVAFGEHRLMFRPRDSHDLRLIDTALTISPAAKVRWLHDVFSNSIAIASFEDQGSELVFESRCLIDHFGYFEPAVPLEDYAQTYPFSYPAEEIGDLGRTIERSDSDPERKVDRWAKEFLAGQGEVDTQELLGRITRAINQQFSYSRRYAVGVQAPAETLDLGSGSCRDLAYFMMAAARSLGLAARFVSGYLYDPTVDDPSQSSVQGAGETHAWVQVYLPGGGWVEFDPTNGLVGGENLIRIAVAREPSQAVPLSGSFFGAAGDFIDMEVKVHVRRAEGLEKITDLEADVA